MFAKYAKLFSRKAAPQSEPVPGETMSPNSAGGYVFELDDMRRFERFLILGSEGGSYYASERALTVANAQCVARVLEADPVRAVETIVEISRSGRAPKNDPAIFALAMAAGAGHVALVAEALPMVCRTGTHLFAFVASASELRGWGKGLKLAVSRWYTEKDAESLAYQVAKYQSREGWSHRDVLRLAHPKSDDPATQSVLRWVVGGVPALGERTVARGEGSSTYPDVSERLPALLYAFEAAKRTSKASALVKLIHDHDLPRECVPTSFLNDPSVWEALLAKMPLTAMVRNLGKMTSIGLLAPLSNAAEEVVRRLRDGSALRSARVHPMSILIASRTYASGRGVKGSLFWTPVSTVVDALDAAFHAAFANVEPTGKRTLLALDVSGSMDGGSVAGSMLTPREASAAMAMITARTEPKHQIVGFTAASGGYGGQWGGGDPGLTPIEVASSMSINDVVAKVRALPMGGTDCAIPMVHALKNGWEVDTFVIYTDNETWAGKIHPFQALKEYRRKTGIAAKLIVVGLTATEFSIADPNDAGMLDVVGFDAAAPALMADFARG